MLVTKERLEPMALISFIYEKDGEQVETIHQSTSDEFTRDSLMDKFKRFLCSLGYVFPKEEQKESCPSDINKQPNFELE